MRTKHANVIRYPATIAAVVASGVLFAVLPFLPGGSFDGARTVSFVAQLVGVLGFVLVPVGVAWLVLDRRRKNKEQDSRVLPLYLILVPGVLLAVQLLFAAPLTEWSRNRVIKNSAEIVHDIEAYKTKHGQYPVSLFAVWPDYAPGVIGIEQYDYEPQGQSYNLIFEQPKFLLDDFGAREFVVYNPSDEHQIVSHAAWRLSDPELHGWYAERDTGTPHWRYFLFD